MDEEDDPIVEEIPVYLSKTMENDLYLFQYPTKSHDSGFDKAQIMSSYYKPHNKEVKINFALNTESRFYERSKGQRLAIAADGKKPQKGERPTYKRGIVDKVTYVSSQTMSDANQYAVGIYADKEIHLTPLTSILQLRSSLPYIEKQDKRKKAEQKAMKEDIDDNSESKQVIVKFARTANGKKITPRLGTYQSYLKRRLEEPWCETYWHPRTTSASELERQKLFGSCNLFSHSLALDTYKYAAKLLPHDGYCQGIDAILPPRVLSNVRLKAMPLIDQLKVILKDAKMLTFNDIVRLIKQHVDRKVTSDKVLRTLSQVGLILHGNWIAQSEILYPSDSLTNFHGVASDLMIRARDYIIFKFSRNNFLYRRQVMAATQLPAEEALDVLKTIAHVTSAKKWELLLPPDKDFENRYPDLVQRQDMIWRATEQQYIEMDSDKQTKRSRKRSIRDSKPH